MLDDAFKAINFDHYPLTSIDYLCTNLKKHFLNYDKDLTDLLFLKTFLDNGYC